MNTISSESICKVQNHKDLLIKAQDFRQKSKSTDKSDEAVNLISFNLLNELYGIELNSLQEILKAKSISKVPGSSDFLQGVINLRGNLITVVDLKRRLGLETENITEHSRVMIVRNRERSIGLLVDKVLEIVKLPKKNISNPSSGLMKAEMKYISKIGKTTDQVITIPDLKEIFQSLI
ncbi:MAG: chemotaxis protein CheW [Proteobacteria bacterium]|nr:chemotaxis protein CheW [Pseudomonadota bacterium]